MLIVYIKVIGALLIELLDVLRKFNFKKRYKKHKKSAVLNKKRKDFTKKAFKGYSEE